MSRRFASGAATVAAAVLPREAGFYSEDSTAAIPDSCFWTHDFVLGAGMVVIQPSSGKVLVVNNTACGTWFLPRGRKDIGETIEQCALREAYEESGYRVEFLPLYLPARAPAPQGRPGAKLEPMVSEPVFITTREFGSRRRANDPTDRGGQYIAFYFVGQIPADAVREESTGMPDEQDYVGTLLELDEALPLLPQIEAHITDVAYKHWRQTVAIEEGRQNGEATVHSSPQSRDSSEGGSKTASS